MQFFFDSATAYKWLGYFVLCIYKLLSLFRIRILHPAVGIRDLKYKTYSKIKKRNRSLYIC